MQIDLFGNPFSLPDVRRTSPATIARPVAPPAVLPIHRNATTVAPVIVSRDWRVKTPKPLLHMIWKEMRRRRIPWSVLKESVLLLTNGQTGSEAKLEESEALEILRQLGIKTKPQ